MDAELITERPEQESPHLQLEFFAYDSGPSPKCTFRVDEADGEHTWSWMVPARPSPNRAIPTSPLNFPSSEK